VKQNALAGWIKSRSFGTHFAETSDGRTPTVKMSNLHQCWKQSTSNKPVLTNEGRKTMLTRWQPLAEVYGEMTRLQNEMNRLFDRNGSRAGVSAGYPAMNMWQDDSNLIVEAEIPGMELDDIEILVDGGNQLTIKGERKSPDQESGFWHRRERGFGQFRRTIELPKMVDADKVEAILKDGILTMTLPKPEEVKPRKITVKAR
jgi:HSP20 family protein